MKSGKLWSVVSAALMLSAAFPADAQTYSSDIHSSHSSQSHSSSSVHIYQPPVQSDPPPIAGEPVYVPPPIPPETPATPDIHLPSHEDAVRQERRDRNRIVSDLISYPRNQPPTIMVRCRQERLYESSRSESHSQSSNSSIRDMLRDRTDRPLTIEIHGNCEEIRIRIESDQQSAELYPDQPSYWEENHEHRGNDAMPWLTRTGSGWDWFLRDR